MSKQRKYSLQNELYLFNKRVCRIFLPPLLPDKEMCYWVRYEDDLDVSIAPNKDLTLLGKNARILYGRNKV
jgi:hypothetical protein